jgi:chromosome segregation protein
VNGEPSVRLRELTLAGFGIYERPTRFLFPDGPAVFVGPNETGKSTLLWGLAAVWFGLPGVSDPGKPGTGRFRSLRGGDEFWGELSWQRGPRLFRLHRRFEAHRVHLTAERDGRTRVLFEGEHNPQGRSSAGTAFPPVLDRWLGVSSLELFLQTFCLMQPLPDSRGIGEELQHLISGSRSGRVDDVLAGLFAQVKVLTRATGDLGLRRPGTSRPTNQRDSGRIEQLEAALDEARNDLAQGERRLKELNAGNEELEHAQAELERIAGERREHEERLATLSLWMQKNRERKERLEKVTLFRRTLEELDRLETERKRAESELSKRFAAYREPPDDLESLLESLEEADAARERAETRLREWTETRGRREAEARDLEKRLETEFGDLGERSDWPGLWRRLSEASARREKRAREIEGLGTEIRRLEEGTKDPGSTPRPGVEVLRAQARGLLDAVGRIDWIEERLRDCDARLEEKRFLGSEGRLERLRESVELEGALRKCSEALREQRDAIALAEERTRTAESAGSFPPSGDAPDRCRPDLHRRGRRARIGSPRGSPRRSARGAPALRGAGLDRTSAAPGSAGTRTPPRAAELAGRGDRRPDRGRRRDAGGDRRRPGHGDRGDPAF